MPKFEFAGKGSEITSHVINTIYEKLSDIKLSNESLRVYLGRNEIDSLFQLKQPDRERFWIQGESPFYGVKSIFGTVEIFAVQEESHFFTAIIRR